MNSNKKNNSFRGKKHCHEDENEDQRFFKVSFWSRIQHSEPTTGKLLTFHLYSIKTIEIKEKSINAHTQLVNFKGMQTTLLSKVLRKM